MPWGFHGWGSHMRSQLRFQSCSHLKVYDWRIHFQDSSLMWWASYHGLLSSFIFFWRFYLFIFRERRREGERDGEKHQCVVVSHTPPTGDLTHNPGMCPDQESNQRPFGSQAYAQSTEPHQPVRINPFNVKLSKKP